MNGNRADGALTPNLFHRPGTMEVLACGVTALVYLGTLAFGFVYDDVLLILNNSTIRSWRSVPQYFTSHMWAAAFPGSTAQYYRPLFLLWLRLNYALFGAKPEGWHATNVLCHMAATYLVFGLARHLTHDRTIAFTAALIFGLHPAHIENVAWIAGVTDPLMACFVLGSCLAFLSFRESGKVSQLIWSLGWFALALLSKETAIVLPLLIAALALVPPSSGTAANDGPPRTTIAMRNAAPYVLLALIYLGVRYRVLKGFAHPAVSISWVEVVLTWPSVLWFYAKHLLLPVGLSEFYPLDYVRHPTAGLLLWPLLLLLALGLATGYWIRALPQKQVAFFALALTVLPLLPVLNLRSITIGDIVHDRYLYLSTAGFTLLAALSIREIARRMSSLRAASLALAGTILIALVFAPLTVIQQTQWASDILLYTRGVESAPDNLAVRENLANALLGAGHPERAIPLYLDNLKRNPNFWRSNYDLGFAYYKTGNPAAAEAPLQRAIGIDGSDSRAYIYLALTELQLKKFPEAADSARRAIAKSPQAREYHFILGLIGENQGDRSGAIAAFKAELAQHPDDESATAELEKIEGRVATRP